MAMNHVNAFPADEATHLSVGFQRKQRLKRQQGLLYRRPFEFVIMPGIRRHRMTVTTKQLRLLFKDGMLPSADLIVIVYHQNIGTHLIPLPR